MNRYAERMQYVKASEIRELLKLTEQGDIISFAGGLPAPETFPLEELKVVSHQVLVNEGTKAMQYSTTEGYNPLRQKIAERMKKLGVETTFNDILITSGSQQGLDFSGKIFIDKGDVIVCENPTYFGATNAFNSYMPTYKTIDTDDEGMVLSHLEHVLQTTERVKFIYAIPDFQNPTGRTWSVERRKGLVELARKYDVLILEDNPYGELRFEGEVRPSFKSFDTDGRVIFLGTFSKILCPGMRLGWICASKEILHKYIMIKQSADLHTNSISQIQAARFLEQYDLDEHIQKTIKLYRSRRDLMLKTMEEEFPKEVKFTHPSGGLFTWLEFPEHINARDLAFKALEKKVAFVPGDPFFPGENKKFNTCRLNYSNMDEERIVKGIKALAEVIKESL